MRYNITCSQLLDDGDTALVEEHHDVEEYDVQDIADEYRKRAFSHAYVESVTISITVST